MQLAELRQQLELNGISLTEKAIASSLSQWAIAIADITPKTLPDVIELFRGAGTGLATTSRATSIPTAPAKGKGKRGGLKRQELTTMPVVRTQEIRQDFEDLQQRQQEIFQQQVLALAEEVKAVKISADQISAAAAGEMFEAIASMNSATLHKAVTLLEEEAAVPTFQRTSFIDLFNDAIANASTIG